MLIGLKKLIESWKATLLGGICCLLAGVVAYQHLPGLLFPLPDPFFSQRPYSLTVKDADGNILRQELGWRDSWRFFAPLSQVSPPVVDATLAAEDHRFFDHPGLDWRAVLRAAADNFRHQRICSGASTLTMQVARMRIPDNPRGWARKIQQTAWALNMEKVYSKEWILQTYLNNAPYGGNIVGIEAAARKYFSKPASRLTPNEAALLAGIPQRPAVLRPDRHPEAARKRQAYVVGRMKKLHPQKYASLSPGFSLCMTETFNPGASSDGNIHYCQLAIKEAGNNRTLDSGVLTTAMVPEIQELLKTCLRNGLEKLEGVNDAAGVVIENRDCSVLGLVGTLDFSLLPDGQVNSAIAARSPGSALKPFIYALAIDKGYLVPETRLNDTPLRIGNYRPENFSGTFSGTVRARDALVQSLNAPAIRVLAKVGVKDSLETLKKCGFRQLNDLPGTYGLALALGGGETTLLELAQAYSGLAREGDFLPVTFLKSPASRQSNRPYSRGTVQLVNDMLLAQPLGGAGPARAAWKTGTSNGLRDAWCCAYTRQLTVAVWFGNKNGKGAHSLVGAKAALPAVEDILAGQEAIIPPETSSLKALEMRALVPVDLCAATGLRKSPFCSSSATGKAVAKIPLQVCKDCRRLVGLQPPGRPGEGEGGAPASRERRKAATPFRILSPLPQIYFTAMPEIKLEFSCPAETEDVAWFLNGRLLEDRGSVVFRQLPKGKYQLVAAQPESGRSDSVKFEIKGTHASLVQGSETSH